MWHDLLVRWREHDLVLRMVEAFDQMLEHTCWMFDNASAVLLGDRPVDEVREPLYARDKVVNGLEGRIRQLIGRHLRMNPSLELSVSLALVSMTKDAERLGDYAKNLFEVAENVPEPLKGAPFFDRLELVRRGVRRHFDLVREALRRADLGLADRVHGERRGFQSECDAILTAFLRGETGSSPAVAVATALMARYYKRVEAHLGNIVEILVTPVSAGGLADASLKPETPQPESVRPAT